MDLTPRDLRALIVEKIDALGESAAAEYFGVGEQTIKSWRAGHTLPKIDSLQKVWDESLIAQTPEMWTGNGAQVQVGLPIYKEQTGLNHITLFANYKQFGPEKLNLIPKFRTLIDEARNDIAHKVRLLRRGSEYTVMCDADMVLPIGNAAALRKLGWTSLPERLGNRWAFQRLMSWGKEYRIVGALYRDRKTGHRAQCERGFRSPQENARLIGIMEGKVHDDGLEENGWVGTGLIRIENSVFDEMAAEAKPGGKLADIAPPQGPRENEPIGFFGRTSKQRGEDVAFCRRAGLLGIKVWCDVGLYCGHEGGVVF